MRGEMNVERQTGGVRYKKGIQVMQRYDEDHGN